MLSLPLCVAPWWPPQAGVNSSTRLSQLGPGVHDGCRHNGAADMPGRVSLAGSQGRSPGGSAGTAAIGDSLPHSAGRPELCRESSCRVGSAIVSSSVDSFVVKPSFCQMRALPRRVVDDTVAGMVRWGRGSRKAWSHLRTCGFDQHALSRRPCAGPPLINVGWTIR